MASNVLPLSLLVGMSLVSHAAAAAPLALPGTAWTSGCLTRPDGPSGAMGMQFSQDQMQAVESQFLDRACTTRTSQIVTEHAYELGAELPLSVPARALDLQVIRVTITVEESTTLDAYNSLRFCGISDWRLGELRDVSDLDCKAGFPRPGERTYTLVGVQTAPLPAHLYMGAWSAGQDGSTADKRPLNLNTATPYQATGG